MEGHYSINYEPKQQSRYDTAPLENCPESTNKPDMLQWTKQLIIVRLQQASCEHLEYTVYNPHQIINVVLRYQLSKVAYLALKSTARVHCATTLKWLIQCNTVFCVSSRRLTTFVNSLKTDIGDLNDHNRVDWRKWPTFRRFRLILRVCNECAEGASEKN